MRPTRTPQNPGQQPPDESQDVAAQVPASDAPAAEETVTVRVSDLNRMLDRIERLEGRAVPTKARAEAEDLPDQGSIDASKISRAVLTKQGWIVPPRMGSHPNAFKA
jgi:hypothetical protein